MGVIRNLLYLYQDVRHERLDWLVEDKFNDLSKQLKKDISKAERDLEFWHSTFRSFSVIPCGYCKKQMRVYPYGGAYYTTDNNIKVHAECYDKYLIKRSK